MSEFTQIQQAAVEHQESWGFFFKLYMINLHAWLLCVWQHSQQLDGHLLLKQMEQGLMTLETAILKAFFMVTTCFTHFSAVENGVWQRRQVTWSSLESCRYNCVFLVFISECFFHSRGLQRGLWIRNEFSSLLWHKWSGFFLLRFFKNSTFLFKYLTVAFREFLHFNFQLLHWIKM